MSKKATKKEKNHLPKEIFVSGDKWGLFAEGSMDKFGDGDRIGRYQLVETGKLRTTTTLEVE